jgi:presenilin-like A22 family membrane protease
MLLLLRFVKGSSIFKIIFSLTIFLGVQLILDAFMPTIFSVSLAILIVFFQFITPQVWLHNLAIVLGVSGIGVALGLSMPVTAVLLILFVLSLYDYIAVYKTHYMVSMFQELLKRGTIFAVIFPRKVAGWLADLTKVKPGTQFLFLGTGDLVLPLVFAASAISYGVESVFWVVFGGLVGVIILHILFVSQPKKFPMPALPPIAFFSVLGFLISLLIR